MTRDQARPAPPSELVAAAKKDCRVENGQVGTPATAASASVYSALDRERLCRQLKALRQQRELTQAQVAAALGWSASKVLRLESGHNAASAADLNRLLVLYQVDDATRPQLVEIAMSTGRQPWNSYRDVFGPQQIAALGQETIATSIRTYQSALIPDLLQTPDYARHLLEVLSPSEFPDTARRRLLDVLYMRQQRLHDDRPHAHFVLAEEALLRGVHDIDPSIVSAQLDALLDHATRPHITVQILPLSVGIPRRRYTVHLVVVARPR